MEKLTCHKLQSFAQDLDPSNPRKIPKSPCVYMHVREGTPGKVYSPCQTRITFTSSPKCFLGIILSLLWCSDLKLSTYYFLFGPLQVFLSWLTSNFSCLQPTLPNYRHFIFPGAECPHPILSPSLTFCSKLHSLLHPGMPFLVHPSFRLWKSCHFLKAQLGINIFLLSSHKFLFFLQYL